MPGCAGGEREEENRGLCEVNNLIAVKIQYMVLFLEMYIQAKSL